MIQFYVGDGKGKTTAAIGLAVRAVGAGKRVAFVQFDQGHDPGGKGYSERAVLEGLTELELRVTGEDRRQADGTFRFENTDEDREHAQIGLRMVRSMLNEEPCDLVVCDELLTCVTTGLVSRAEVEELLDVHGGREAIELVMTGRCDDEALLDRADLVTEMRNVKHYYDAGVKARRGYDY